MGLGLRVEARIYVKVVDVIRIWVLELRAYGFGLRRGSRSGFRYPQGLGLGAQGLKTPLQE